ncbi:MAG: hypothetical protein FJW30_22920 [Acidobacteria bacterium]|nr:hypothetical protein [Acidobacteriota bacterium]
MLSHDLTTDRRRSSLSEILLYAEHPFQPIHAALFSNFDGTLSLVVCARDGSQAGRRYTVSLGDTGQPFAKSVQVTLRTARGENPSDSVTFEDTGLRFNAIRFETAQIRQQFVC